ncbi:MAG: GNAT family N-acetyltransferase [Bdellovibrionaceae bacterium]|nr:GNAT family N-acetyltransferase [Pseudobdellovibrionaceae bacterium]
MKIAEQKFVLKNSKNVTLRSAVPEDAENLLRHLVQSHSESYRNLNNPGEFWARMSVEEERKILAEMDSAKNKFMLVALHEDAIVGGLGLFAQTAEFVKQNASLGMSIQREFCNSGLGTELMRLALTKAKIAGLHRLDLLVRTYNLEGIALYEKMGFQRIGLLKEIAFVDGQYVDEFSYQLILK